jgi:protein-disulfide isomerase
MMARRVARASAVALMALGLSMGAGVALDGEVAPAWAQKKNAADSDIIPVGDSPVLGKSDALVTIVEFADYQCPFCDRANTTIGAIKQKYGKDVRVVFKQFPLSFHKEADDAARAALAAGEQGKYWEMHETLFDNFKEFKSRSSDFDAYAAELAKEAGVKNLKKFASDLSKNATKYDAIIARDQKLGEKLGVRGTPHFFINGVRLSGAQPQQKFEEVVDAELAAARAELKKLGKKKLVYAARVKANYEEPEAPKPRAERVQRVEFVPVNANDATWGSSSKALVTIVEFSDFQCPFCNRGAGTVDEIKKKYGKDVRIVFKHLPLPFHKEAEPAAVAALAAGRQGKFWEMHDLLFARQRDMKSNPELFIELADQLGLKLDRFERDLKDPALMAQVKADMALANEVGARGTPNFYINGVQLVGAQPITKFSEVIDAQLAVARKLKKKNKKLKGEKLYAKLVDYNKENRDEAAKAAEKARKAEEKRAAKEAREAGAKARKVLAVAGSPVWGDVKKAKVVIYEFTDLQCPYCARAKGTLDQIKNTYGDDVAIVSKSFPLAFHKQAEGGAIAALAAGRQGKFWEMRAAIFERQRDMKSNPELFIELADGIGLDLDRFEKDLKDPAIAAQVKAEMDMGAEVGVRGTPNFFVNGVRVTGAQPFEAFKKVIDEQLEGTK